MQHTPKWPFPKVMSLMKWHQVPSCQVFLLIYISPETKSFLSPWNWVYGATLLTLLKNKALPVYNERSSSKFPFCGLGIDSFQGTQRWVMLLLECFHSKLEFIWSFQNHISSSTVLFAHLIHILKNSNSTFLFAWITCDPPGNWNHSHCTFLHKGKPFQQTVEWQCYHECMKPLVAPQHQEKHRIGLQLWQWRSSVERHHIQRTNIAEASVLNKWLGMW